MATLYLAQQTKLFFGDLTRPGCGLGAVAAFG